MPIFAENNKPRLLYYLKRRGYRGYSMNRPDRTWNKLSTTEKEIGGIPNSSEDIRQAHAAAIESYINSYVGIKSDGTYGDIYFNETLNDWAKFDINKRTKFDAAISSGLAIMACNKHLYRPNAERQKSKVNILALLNTKIKEFIKNNTILWLSNKKYTSQAKQLATLTKNYHKIMVYK